MCLQVRPIVCHCLSLFGHLSFVFKESNLQGRELRSILVYSRLSKSTVNSLVIKTVANTILSQHIEGKWHPVAYRSRTLSETEMNYEIHDKELMAVMDSLADWRQYLLGARCTFEIWTDHQNLQYFRKPQKLNR